MKSVIALFAIVIGVAGAASAQTPEKPPAQPREKPFVFQMPREFQAPKDYAGLPDKRDFALNFDGAADPKKAPPGQLCLLKAGDERCPQEAKLVRKPFEPGDVDLYLLDQEAGKQKMVLKTVPLDDKLGKLPKEKAPKLEARPKRPD
jgi:hypothetical protein